MTEKPEELALRVKVQRMYEAADRIMQEAIAPDKLQNNPYKGRPLDLPINPFDKGMGMAHRMLKSSGFAPTWIELKKELIQEQKDIRRMIDQYVDKARVTGDARTSKLSSRPEREPNPIHAKFLQRVYERVARLRKKIERYNLETPLMDQQLMNVRPEEWVAKVRERLQ